MPRWLDRIVPLCTPESDGLTRALCLDRNDKLLGGSWTHNFTESPNEGAEYSYSRPTLAEILETGPVPECYFLTQKARNGILSRAQTRGKKLPPMLAAVLAASGTGSK